MKKLLLALVLGFLAVPAIAKPLPVVVSFTILGDLVRQVGGDAVTVTSLVGPDGDAHSYEARPDDVKAVAKAQLVVINGLGFDDWMQRLTEASGYRGSVVVASTGFASHPMSEEGKSITDPHAWQDVSNTRLYVKNIAAALIKALPDQAAAITTRAKVYDDQLISLDQRIRAQLAAIPETRRVVITSHDAFGYFAQAYKVRVLAPEGINPEAQPDAAAIAQLQKQIKATHVKVLYLENMTNSRLITQIAKDTGAQIGGTLYADALSPADGPASTYRKMIESNVALMVQGMK